MNLFQRTVHLAGQEPHLRERLLPLLREAQESYQSQGVVFRPFQRATFWYRHERLHRKQDKEPVGAYVVATSEDQADGKITVRRPLILDWKAYRGTEGWVLQLVEKYGVTRKRLTQVLRKKRIDAIVTIRRNRTYQIVLLNVPLGKEGVDAEKIQQDTARKKRQRLFDPPTDYTLTYNTMDGDGETSQSLEENIEQVFGPSATTQDLLALSGFEGLPSHGKYNVVVTYVQGMGFVLQVEGDGIHTLRRVVKVRNGEVVLNNSSLFLTDDAPPGAGTRLFYSQVLAAQSLGIDRIECKAAKSGFSVVGYYVWARLGYNARLSYIIATSAATPQERQNMWQGLRRILSAFPDPTNCTMHDLMMTPGGRKWWKRNGIPWKATFDLTPTSDGGPSPSMQVLETYVREKAASLDKPIGKWAHSEEENLYLSHQDEAILDWVWEIMRERNRDTPLPTYPQEDEEL